MKKVLLGFWLSATIAVQSFGFGGIVFDPTNFAQLVKAYGLGTAQLAELGSMVGLNTDQLNMLTSVQNSLGIAKGDVNFSALNSKQLVGLAQGLKIAPDGVISKIYQKSGEFAGGLDIFMGASFESFKSGYANPMKNFQDWATKRSLGSLGGALGLGSGETEFAAQIAQKDESWRAQNKTNIGLALTSLAANRYAAETEHRAVALQALANRNQQASDAAGKAKSLNETAQASAQIAATAADLQALQAAQQDKANALLISQGNNTVDLLRQAEARRAREQAEKDLARRNGGAR